MKKLFLAITGVVLVSALGLSLLINLYFVGRSTVHSSSSKDFQESTFSGDNSSDGKIALIDLAGVISYEIQGDLQPSMVEDITAKLKQAREDSSIKAILLRIDSPGGEVTASDVIYHEIVKTNKVKPVVSYVESVGASGAYYSAVGTRYIMANELSITASIGVIMQTMNFEKLGDKVGVQSMTFKSGKMKDLLNPFRPVSDEERAYVQGLIDETYAKFVGIVAKERKLDETKLRATVADGRILSGKSAVQEKLIDATGYIEDAIHKTCELAKLPEDAEVVRLEAPFSISRYFRFLGKSSDISRVQVNLGPESIRLESGKLYYISQHLFTH